MSDIRLMERVAAILASGPRGTLDEWLADMPHLLAALAADGLTVTPTQTALAGETFRAYIDAKHPSKTIFHIERLLAIGEAVERLPYENLTIRRCPTDDEYQWCVAINAVGYVVGCGPILPEAIAAALGDDDD